MKLQYSPPVLQVVRYGLPLVLLIFYVSASWNFSYTPDSTYLSLRMTTDIVAGSAVESMPAQPLAAPNPLWLLFVAFAAMAKLDLLLAAKIFSLFFSSLAVLLAYLLAAELLRDRFLAFCAALAIATSGLLLQIAPAGSAVPLGLTLVLAALFFMLRNDYLVSALMLGLGTLVFWQAAGALVLLLLDAWMNSTSPGRKVRIVLLSTVMYVLTVVPWFLFVALRTVPPIPWLVGLGDFPSLSVATGAAAAIPAGIAAAGAVGAIQHNPVDGLSRQSHVIVVLWACWFLACWGFWGWDFFLFALPLIVVYAFSVIQQVTVMSRSAPMYARALFLTGILILVHQLAFNLGARPAITTTEEASEELVELSYWIKDGIPEKSSVSATRPELLAYYSGRPVGQWSSGTRPSTEFVVSEAEDVWGYAVVHRASLMEAGDLLSGAGHFAVWRVK